MDTDFFESVHVSQIFMFYEVSTHIELICYFYF